MVIDEEKLSILRLIRSENLGIKSFFSIINLYGSAKLGLANINDIASYRGKKIKIISEQDALLEIEKTEEYGAAILFFSDSNYPSLLKEIVDFPPVITVLGKNIGLMHKNKIAVVGSRNSSINGNRFAYKISKEIGEKGYAVVSGLARGIDASAHRASLESGTIAVIAGGINNIYPVENKSLYADICSSGLIITENPFDSQPKAINFPQRNRIISGLSIATVVVEASLKSGSLISARFANEQNREVFAVPGFPLDPRYSGTNKLIKEGAHLLESIDDITDEMTGINIPKNLFVSREDVIKEEKSDLLIEKDIKHISSELDKIEKLVLSNLSTTPVDIDFLIRTLEVPRNLLMLVIVELELIGKIHRINNSLSIAV